jgi:hypothetical protein
MLLAGTVVMAGGPKRTRSSALVLQPSAETPTECRPFATETTFTVSSGPSFVACEDDPSGQCTEIEYTVSPRPDGPVFALEGIGVVFASGEYYAAPPCEGIGVFGVGSCHEQAVQTDPFLDIDGSWKVRIRLAGLRSPSPTSVAFGSSQEPLACEILGIGLQNSSNPEQATQTTETINFKGCVVKFTRDAKTGEVLNAELTPDSPDGCQSPFFEGRTLIPQPVTELNVRLKDGTSLGTGKFGDGYISTGGDSCTTRVIGGKVYTWGSPCPPK